MTPEQLKKQLRGVQIQINEVDQKQDERLRALEERVEALEAKVKANGKKEKKASE